MLPELPNTEFAVDNLGPNICIDSWYTTVIFCWKYRKAKEIKFVFYYKLLVVMAYTVWLSWGEVRGFLPTPHRARTARSCAVSWVRGFPGVNDTAGWLRALLHWRVYSSMDDDKENLNPWGHVGHNLVNLVKVLWLSWAW